MIEKIIELIREILPYEQINENTELVESGILNSLSIVALITQLEDEFCVEIADDAVTAKNFSSVREILRLIEENNKT